MSRYEFKLDLPSSQGASDPYAIISYDGSSVINAYRNSILLGNALNNWVIDTSAIGSSTSSLSLKELGFEVFGVKGDGSLNVQGLLIDRNEILSASGQPLFVKSSSGNVTIQPSGVTRLDVSTSGATVTGDLSVTDDIIVTDNISGASADISGILTASQVVVSGSNFPLASFTRTNSANASFELANTVATRYFGVNPTGGFGIGPNGDLGSSPWLTLTGSDFQINSDADVSGDLTVSGDITTTSGAFFGDGSNLTGVVGSVGVEKNGTLVGTRGRINFIEGSNVTLNISDDSGNNEVDVTIASSGSGSGSGSGGSYSEGFNATTDWGSASGGLYSMTINHSLGTSDVTVDVWDETSSQIQTFTGTLEVVDSNNIRMSVPDNPDSRFSGRAVVLSDGGTGGSSGGSSINAEGSLPLSYSTVFPYDTKVVSATIPSIATNTRYVLTANVGTLVNSKQAIIGFFTSTTPDSSIQNLTTDNSNIALEGQLPIGPHLNSISNNYAAHPVLLTSNVSSRLMFICEDYTKATRLGAKASKENYGSPASNLPYGFTYSGLNVGVLFGWYANKGVIGINRHVEMESGWLTQSGSDTIVNIAFYNRDSSSSSSLTIKIAVFE